MNLPCQTKTLSQTNSTNHLLESKTKCAVALSFVLAWILCSMPVFAAQVHQGLVGAWYQGTDLTRVGTGIKLSQLDLVIDTHTGHGNNWSAHWVGYITAPATARVTFYGESSKELIVRVADKQLIHVGQGNNKTSGHGNAEHISCRKSSNAPKGKACHAPMPAHIRFPHSETTLSLGEKMCVSPIVELHWHHSRFTPV